MTHSFRTRGSSDLQREQGHVHRGQVVQRVGVVRVQLERLGIGRPSRTTFPVPLQRERSEEHTSELQSLMRISYAVFCLKKKTSFYHFFFFSFLSLSFLFIHSSPLLFSFFLL